jgi:hypothetical protein
MALYEGVSVIEVIGSKGGKDLPLVKDFDTIKNMVERLERSCGSIKSYTGIYVHV